MRQYWKRYITGLKGLKKNAELPVVQCRGENILKCLDDVLAVSFETYIVSERFSAVLHSDDRCRISIWERA